MSEDNAPKSAYEVAMERLKKADAAALEFRRACERLIAERDATIENARAT